VTKSIGYSSLCGARESLKKTQGNSRKTQRFSKNSMKLMTKSWTQQNGKQRKSERKSRNSTNNTL